MNQNNQSSVYAALGLAGQMGCLMATFAIAALFIGLLIDHVFDTHKIAILVCVSVSFPINLLVSFTLTQRLMKRIVPPLQTGTVKNPSGDDTTKTE